MGIKDYLLNSDIWLFITNKYPEIATKVLYRLAMGKKLNLEEPHTLNEKMQWLKLYEYRNNEIVKECADKYRVRNYLCSKGCSPILNELYGVWKTPEEIDWNSLPERFVLKCTHGSGYNIICEDKKRINKNNVNKTLSAWVNEKYGKKYCELIYDGIEPRIIAERYIDTEDGKAPTDYKFFCTYGEPKFLYVMQGNDEIQDYYTAAWEWLPVRSAGRPNSEKRIVQPKKYQEMMDYASILSKDFPLVRVDFYYEQDTIIFGELTFLTTGGFTKYDPEEYDMIFGEMFPDVKSLQTR